MSEIPTWFWWVLVLWATLRMIVFWLYFVLNRKEKK